MRQFFSKNKKVFGYVVYAFLLAIVLLYYRFPSGTVSDLLENKVSQAYPGIMVSFDKVSPMFPIRLKFQNVEIRREGEPSRQVFTAESFTIGPKILRFIKGDHIFDIDSSLYEGKVKGFVQYNNDSDGNSLNTELELEDIKIEKGAYLSDIIGRRIEGLLEGKIIFQGAVPSLLKGSGEASLKLSNGLLYLQAPILGLESIDFDQLSLNMGLKNQRITLSSTEIKSPKMRGSATGSISLRKDFNNSRIDLRVTVEPYSALLNDLGASFDTVKNLLKNGQVTISIRGTISDPRINFV